MLRRPKADLAVLAGFLAISFAYVGWRVAAHPGRALIGGSTRDPEFFIWSFAWWPHALAHLLNPFISHVIYAPTGINLTWTATSPGLAIVLAPVTLLFGPAVSYNVAAIALPALAAWTGYLLCRYLTRSLWASVVGGYVFGFSGGILQEELWGNLHTTSAFLLPLIVLVLLRLLRAELTARGFAIRFGLLIAAQLWIGTEFAFAATFFIVLGIPIAYWLVPDVRSRLRAALAPIGAGYALGGLFASPFLVYALIGIPPGPFGNTSIVGSDLLNFVVPTPVIALGGSTLSSESNRFVVGGAYLGIPLLLIMGAYAIRNRRVGAARFLIAALLVCVVCSLGTRLQIADHKLLTFPWRLVSGLPGFEDAFPFRFTIFVSLVAGVMAALWIASTKGRIYARPFVLPVLAVAALVPAVWQSSFRAQAVWTPERPAFFTEGLYKTCVPRGETLAIFPFGYFGDSVLWQGEADFWFRLAGDNLLPVAHGYRSWTSFDSDWAVLELNTNDVARPTMATLLAFAANHHVDRLVSVVGDGYPTAAEMRSFGPTEQVGGVLVSPGCGRPSLLTRNLSSFVAEYNHELASQETIGYCSGVNFTSLPAGLEPSGPLLGATRARFVVGQGLTCASPPAGYTRHGFATAAMNVPADTYPLYSP